MNRRIEITDGMYIFLIAYFFLTKTLKQTTLLEAILIVFVNIAKIRFCLIKISSIAVDSKNVGVSVICQGFFSPNIRKLAKF